MRQTTKSLSLVGRPTSTLSDGRVGEEPTPEPSLERNREGYFTGVEGISVGGIRKRHTEGAGGAGGARGLSLKQLKVKPGVFTFAAWTGILILVCRWCCAYSNLSRGYFGATFA